MSTAEIKNISIRKYLKQLSISPQKETEHAGIYRSPFREDVNASFKVDYNLNLWYDFGTGEGGSIIDLVMKMENCSFHEAANKLENEYVGINPDSFSFHRNEKDEPTAVIQNILSITHPKLIAWVRERKIDLNLANLYCREIHYQIRDKNYFSVGFGNDKGGYELSNPPNFKSCISPKEITTFKAGRNLCLVFEGFWDFLSYLTLQKIEKSKHDVVVLNSTANVSKALDFLKSHKEIYCYSDNDEGGRKATETIKSVCSNVNDRSVRYAKYKDLNDFLRGKLKENITVKKKKMGLKR
jgi:DNA primase